MAQVASLRESWVVAEARVDLEPVVERILAETA
jgi:hypothetical protein